MKDSDYLGPDTPTMNLSRSEKKKNYLSINEIKKYDLPGMYTYSCRHGTWHVRTHLIGKA